MRFPLFRTLVLLPVVAGWLASCSQSADNSTADQPAAKPRVRHPERAAPVLPPPDTARAVTREHVFSDPKRPDTFKLTLLGDSAVSALALLTIKDATGQEIFRHLLTAGELEGPLVYELNGSPATDVYREAWIRARMRRFFADSTFSSPAVGPREAYQPGFVSQAEWQDLQKPGTVGFRYTVGKEDGHRISWSPRARKVVRYGAFGG